MTRTLLYSAMGTMLSIGLAAGAYAAQGQTDAGTASGQASPDTRSKLGSPAQPRAGQSISPGTVGRTQSIEGEVLRIEGNTYVVKDTAGKEIRLHVDKHTNIDGNISSKDLIVARASRMSTTLGDGHRSIDPNQSMSGGSSRGMSDPHHGMSSDRSEGAITWHADSIKKR